MTTIKDITGVKKKEIKSALAYGTDMHECGMDDGFNNCLYTEVVVDKEKIKEAMVENYLITGWHLNDKDTDRLAQAIATAIENGDIISLKGER